MFKKITWIAVLLALGCDNGAEVAPIPEGCKGSLLFGRPGPKTGLGDDQCQPRCTCGGKLWEAPVYTAEDATKLLAWTLLNPPAELLDDPYQQNTPAPGPAGQVCGVVPEPAGSKSYRLETFSSKEAAASAGGVVTHTGACGLCSTLRDLAVYMNYPDLTDPVRACGLMYITGPKEDHVLCLEALGFTRPCAEIWYFNTLNTGVECGGPCLASVNLPYHLADGQLNACLLCDEEKSGPVFKAVAGRTRRNTGIASALCRPCDDVEVVEHVYE